MVVIVKTGVENGSVAGVPVVALAAGQALIVAPDAVLTTTSDTGTSVITLAGTNEVFIRGTIFGSGDAIAENAGVNRIFVDAGGFIGGEERGINLFQSSLNVIDNAGTISAGDIAVYFGQGGNRLGNSGLIQGMTAVESAGGLDLDNSGVISGAGGGVRALGGLSRVHNTGEILCATVTVGAPDVTLGALYFRGTQASVVNEGSIRCTGGPGIIAGFASTTLVVENTGTIEGETYGVLGAFAADRVTNAGTMIGRVELGSGADLYDGALGRMLRGDVSGGAGADTLVGGAEREVLAGGADADSLDGGAGDDVLRPGAGLDIVDGGAGARDLLDYLGSAAVNVALALGEASGGDAQGDEFTGIEWVAGGTGNDTLAGDALANALFGRAGNDSLVGGGGNDVLVGDIGADTLLGGAGIDVLRGGANADRFVFALTTESGAPGVARDRIADFVKAELDRIDLSLIDASAAVAGNQAFAFIGAAGFTAAGQVRAQVIGGNTFVFANTDANTATAEFSLLLTGSVALAGTDFVL
jgi:Ca2+-binding RTX toxin-like protein